MYIESFSVMILLFPMLYHERWHICIHQAFIVLLYLWNDYLWIPHSTHPFPSTKFLLQLRRVDTLVARTINYIVDHVVCVKKEISHRDLK